MNIAVLPRTGVRGFLALATVAAGLALPAAAQAYQVHVSITGAGQVTETTNANLIGPACFTSGTNPTGTVGKDCFAGTTSGDYQWGWTVRYLATAKPGYRFVHWQSDGNPKPVICDGASGSDVYTDTGCQFATYDNLQTRAVFVDDTSPSLSSLTGPNQVVNGPATFTFSATADPTLRYLQCRVAGVHDWQVCTSGRQENPPTGSYTFQLRAVDWSGNTSPESTWNWTVDKVTPETTLAPGGPSGTVASSSAQFSFNANEQASFICTLDGVVDNACGSPKSYANLPDGQHTFSVQARDVAGNLDPTPDSRTWTVDTTAPDTTLDVSGPSGSTTATGATFTFSSEPGASFRCKLDGIAVENPCTSPRAYSGLGAGPHTFTVWARDAVGNEDASPATRSWTVTAAPDTTAPVVVTPNPTPPPPGPGTQTPAPPRFDPFISSFFDYKGAKTRFTALLITRVPAGSKVRVTCKGKRCPLEKRSFAPHPGTLNLLKRLKRLVLRAGNVLEVRVSSAKGDTKVGRWTIRKGKPAKFVTRCAAPGAKLGACG